MLGRIKVFGEEVCDVDNCVNVGDCEFAVAHAVADPMESHINGFASILFDRISCNADRARIITHEHSRGLRVSKVGEDSSKTSGMLGTSEDSSVFGFASTGDDARNDGGEHLDRPIDFERFVAITEKECAPSDRPSV